MSEELLGGRPILTPYEIEVMIQEENNAVLQDNTGKWLQSDGSWQNRYPMDYYSNDAGPWGNMFHRKNNTVKSV